MNSAADVLASMLQLLESRLSKTTISTWFEDAEAVELTDSKLVIYTPTPFKQDVIVGRYADLCNEALREIFSADVTLEVVTEKPDPSRPADDDPELSSRLSDLTFASFVVGPSNAFAHAAAEAVSQAPGRKWNPLFIYGGSGLGKTHLLCAIANSIRRQFPEKKIVYRKGEEFTNEVIAAVRSSSTEAIANLHNTYRMADLLLIDDIQFIAGKEATQNEFFHTFDVLYEAQKQIVVSSDRPPREMYTLEERIRSRLEAGLLADIQAPDYETRMAILANKAAKIHLKVEEKYLQYIANNITANVRQLEGTVKKLAATSSLMGKEITQSSVSAAVKDVLRETPGLKPTANLIIEEVASFYDIEPDALRSNSRRKDTLTPRQVAMYVMREMTGMSLPEIGREFGKDHATVLHAVKKIEQNIRAGKEPKNEVRDIIHNITNR